MRIDVLHQVIGRRHGAPQPAGAGAVAPPGPAIVFADDCDLGFGSAGSSIARAGGTMLLTKAMTCAPLMDSVVPSKFALLRLNVLALLYDEPLPEAFGVEYA